MKKMVFGETDGIREKVGKGVLRPENVKILGEAIREVYGDRRVLLGRDTRESGIWIVEELKKAFDAERIVDCGVLPTPAIAKAVMDDYQDDLAIMVTASHNPATDNGIKIFKNGTKIPDEEELAIEKAYFALLEKADEKALEREIEAFNGKNAIDEYRAEFAEKYAENASAALGEAKIKGGRTKIVLDAACGAGHSFSKAVFEKFDIEVIEIDDMPDGKNINDGFGALYPEKLAAKAKELGLPGLALDGDADRTIIADEEGRIWNGDRIVVFLAEYLKERGELLGNGVVLTEYSNLATVQYLESRGIKVLKVVNGDKEVTRLSIANGLILGGEQSGHILYQPWLDSSDGTFMMLFVLSILQDKGVRLADLWADYEDKPSLQVAVRVTEKKPVEELAGWNEAVAEIREKMGVDGRVFVRYSGTENKLRILVEYSEMEKAQEWAEELARIVRKEIGE